ncbi:Uncharacterised protein [uncultured archaeon]|nr:Uncharacterised protein [uncultured archaeon]
MEMMKLTYDKEADAVYIYLKEISEGEVSQTISLNESINIDLSSERKVLGIEILNASKNLPLNTIKSAKEIN